MYIYIYIYTCVYIYIYIYIYYSITCLRVCARSCVFLFDVCCMLFVLCCVCCAPACLAAPADADTLWVFRDVVFQDVRLDMIVLKPLTHIRFRCEVPTPSVFEGQSTIMFKPHILKHRIPELPRHSRWKLRPAHVPRGRGPRIRSAQGRAYGDRAQC